MSTSRAKLAVPLSRAEVGFEQLVPAGEHRAYAISDRPAAGVQLGGGGGEEAATGEDAALDVGQVALAQLLEALPALGELHGRLDHLGGVDRLGGGDGRELQVLLGGEVGEEAALAHPDLVGDAGEREALEPFERGQPGGGVEDRAVAALAVGAGASLACGLGRHGSSQSALTS